MTLAELTNNLHKLAEPEYRSFAAALIPGEQDLLGVRLPALRKLAKQAASSNRKELFAALRGKHTMEFVMLRGMLPGYAKEATLAERLAELAEFIPTIRNWSICDSCCSTYRFVRRHREEVLEFLLPYLSASQEYAARFGVVMLLNHYVAESAWAERVATLLPAVSCPAYYARMAVAWCACELYLRYPDIAARLFPRLSPEILALTQRKIRESRRRPPEKS